MGKLSGALVIAGVAALVWSLMGSSTARAATVTPPGQGLAGSYHDFVNGPWATSGTSGFTYTAPAPFTNTTVGLCTFCHAPHHASTTELLWNHTLATSTYSWDVTSTTAGTTYPQFADQTYGGPTAKCLSCHDGTISPGDFVTYQGQTGTNTQAAGTYSTYALVPGPLAQNMKGMHPVAMPYPYGGAPNTYNGVTTGANINFTQFQATPLGPVRLYTDISGTGAQIVAGPTSGKSGIECSSCHDPHNRLTVDYDLLLGMDSGTDTNYICLKCHIK